MRAVRSDSAGVRRDAPLRRRVRVRCAIPSLRDKTALRTCSRSASEVTEPTGSPFRTSWARSSGFLITFPRTLRPPKMSAIACVSISASCLLIIRHLADLFLLAASPRRAGVRLAQAGQCIVHVSLILQLAELPLLAFRLRRDVLPLV